MQEHSIEVVPVYWTGQGQKYCTPVCECPLKITLRAAGWICNGPGVGHVSRISRRRRLTPTTRPPRRRCERICRTP